MNSFGKFARFLTAAVMLAAFALPASAAKSISLGVTPVPAPLSSLTTAVRAIITNTGNSNANSFEVSWTTPSPYFRVTGASIGSTPFTCSTPGVSPGKCTFLFQLPTKTSVPITLSVEVTTNECTALSINWSASAWTGAPGDVSQSFALDAPNPPGAHTTSSSPNCSIKFFTPPNHAFITSKITGSPFNSAGAAVSVQLLRGVTPVSGKVVSLSAVPETCATPTLIGGTTATTDASGIAELNFTAMARGSCQLRASEAVYGSVDSAYFNVVQQDGNLGCTTSTNNKFPLTSTDALPANGSTRLPNVKDPKVDAPDAIPPDCVQVPYDVSTTCPDGVTGTCTNFVYDPRAQGTHMAFAFHWEWPVEAIPALGIEAIRNTQQLFLNGSTTPLELDLCPEIIPTFGNDGTFIGLAPTSRSPLDYDSPPGTQAGCLVRRIVKQVGGKIQIIEDAYVQGDYSGFRN